MTAVDITMLILQIIIVFLALLSVTYTIGVVIRVEKKLDVSYKEVLTAIIAFAIAETLAIFKLENQWWLDFVVLVFRLLFVIFFLSGILEMRKLVRKLDGEIKEKKNDPINDPIEKNTGK